MDGREPFGVALSRQRKHVIVVVMSLKGVMLGEEAKCYQTHQVESKFNGLWILEWRAGAGGGELGYLHSCILGNHYHCKPRAGTHDGNPYILCEIY